MIKYKVTIGEVTTELECQTIGELIEYLNYDKEEQEEIRVVVEADRFVVKSNEPIVWNGSEYWPKTQQFFARPDNTIHSPKTEVIDGEEWYVNDGQQPVRNDVRVDMLRRDRYNICDESAGERNWAISGVDAPSSYDFHITHWRLAK